MNFNLMTPQPIETVPLFERVLAWNGWNWLVIEFADHSETGFFTRWLPLPPAPEPTSDFLSVAKDIIKTSL